VSLALLEGLDSQRVFESTLRFEDLAEFHVPFDLLVGDEATEATLRDLAEHQGKVALIGPSGSGKSSVIASVLGPLAEDLADDLVPIRIPVAATNATTIQQPVAFAQHLLRTVIRYASEIIPADERMALERSAADQITATGRERSTRINVGAPRILTDTGLSTEVRSGAEQIINEVSASGAIGSMPRLAEIFRARGREPLWIIDDSDRWLRIGGEDQTEVAEAFFRRIVPMLAREIDCGFVIAVHEQYLGLAAYRESRPLLSRVIDVPTPPDPRAAIATIVDHRMGLFFGPEAGTDELIDESGLDLLATNYSEGRSLRNVIATLNRATQLACTDRVEKVDRNLIQTALADLS
jgi:Cdc6-like AAA superfamily ATPase